MNIFICQYQLVFNPKWSSERIFVTLFRIFGSAQPSRFHLIKVTFKLEGKLNGE